MSDLFLDEVIRPEAEPVSRRAARRSEREQRERRRGKRRRRTVLALVLSVGLVGGAGYAVWTLAGPLFDFSGSGTQTADYPGPGVGSVQVEIPAGATGTEMARILHEADVVASERAFTRAFAANSAAAGIQPGTYELAMQMSAADAVTALLDPDRRVQMRVTIPEGRQLSQILETLSSKTAIPVEDFEAALADSEALGLPAEAEGSYEGWLFPATYTFEPGTTPAEMLSTMIAQMVAVLDERGVAPEDRKTVLTKASLVEREAPDNDEARTKMARAIENRLARDMRLQIDAAVAYGLGKSGTELTREDISSEATENPYNTYAHTGLPPTPIASPGVTAIDAVLNPADGPWVFWVTVNLDTGETRFAETYDEHLENEALLRQWQAENGG